MSKTNVSPKLERKSDEDVEPIPNVSLGSVDGAKSFAESDNSSKNIDSESNKGALRGDEENPNVDTGDEDQPDGNVIAYFRSDVFDDELKTHNVKLFSCSQQSGAGEGFLKMVVDDDAETGLKVTTTGAQSDPYVLWKTHYTLDDEHRQVIIFENKKCSELTNTKCVLWTEKVGDNMDYILTGKKITVIPRRLSDIDPSFGYYKHPKSVGSELLYLKSMYSTKEKPLLIGFDGAGQPLPLNKVKKYSQYFHAFFRIIPG